MTISGAEQRQLIKNKVLDYSDLRGKVSRLWIPRRLIVRDSIVRRRKKTTMIGVLFQKGLARPQYGLLCVELNKQYKY